MTLTQRQFDVVSRLARGMTNKAVAKELRISPNTVHVHSWTARDQYDVATLPELYIALGWMQVPETYGQASLAIPAGDSARGIASRTVRDEPVRLEAVA